MSDAEFNAFLAEVDAWESDRDYAFRQYQDQLDRQEFEREMAFRQSEVEREQSTAAREYDLAVQELELAKSTTKKNGKNDTKSSTKNVPVTYSEFCSRTGVYSILTEAEFYSSRLAGDKYTTYQQYLAEMFKEYA